MGGANEDCRFRVFAKEGALGVAGTIDADSAPRFARVLHAAAVPKADLVLDLSELEAIDQAGVRAVFDEARVISSHGHRLSVRQAPAIYHDMCAQTSVQ